MEPYAAQATRPAEQGPMSNELSRLEGLVKELTNRLALCLEPGMATISLTGPPVPQRANAPLVERLRELNDTLGALLARVAI